MAKSGVHSLMLVFVLLGALGLACKVQKVKASGTIYIQANGEIDPPTSPIEGDGVRYNFTGDISDEIVVLRSNIIIDGRFHTLQGSGSGSGFSLTGMSNVTIWRTTIVGFTHGIFLDYSPRNRVTGNTLLANTIGIAIYGALSVNNTIVGNNITGNDFGVDLTDSESNLFYHNSFVDNGVHARVWVEKANSWDVTPFGGNYWSNYTGVDETPSPDGLGDTPHTINADNVDHHPLMGRSFSMCLEFLIESEWGLICAKVVSNSSRVESFHLGSLKFNVTGSDDTIGFCRVAMPHDLLAPPYTVTVNNIPVTYTIIFENATLSIIYFTYMHSTREIVIIPEIASLLILPLLMTATLVAAVIHRRRRRSSLAKMNKTS